MNRSIPAAGAALLLVASSAFAAGELQIGDPPPAMTVGEWVKGTPVTTFSDGGTYVVEFWATWCGPCRKAIPHMSELARSYGDRVRFVGVSVWEDDQAEVAPFVERMGDQMAYNVAMDAIDAGAPKGAMAANWMKAAGQDGIPTAFIVNGGKVAWIGSPFEIDDPLAKIVAGEWDLAVARERFAAKMERERRVRATSTKVQAAMQNENWTEVVALVDAWVAESPAAESEFGVQKFIALLHTDAAASSAYGRKLVDGAFKSNPGGLNWVAWAIVDPEVELVQRDLKLALDAARRANELTGWEEAGVLDTYARALFLSGDVRKALELQTTAVEHSAGTPFEKELEDRLEEYREALKSQG